MANVVLGHYPEYLELASKIDCAKTFCVPSATWRQMSPCQQWADNVRFLNAAIDQRDAVVFSHHPSQARLGSSFSRELRHLRNRGVMVLSAQDAYLL